MRNSHNQNIILADVEQAQLFTLWNELREQGFATPNVGLLTDIICCPGGDFCPGQRQVDPGGRSHPASLR